MWINRNGLLVLVFSIGCQPSFGVGPRTHESGILIFSSLACIGRLYLRFIQSRYLCSRRYKEHDRLSEKDQEVSALCVANDIIEMGDDNREGTFFIYLSRGASIVNALTGSPSEKFGIISGGYVWLWHFLSFVECISSSAVFMDLLGLSKIAGVGKPISKWILRVLDGRKLSSKERILYATETILRFVGELNCQIISREEARLSSSGVENRNDNVDQSSGSCDRKSGGNGGVVPGSSVLPV